MKRLFLPLASLIVLGSVPLPAGENPLADSVRPFIERHQLAGAVMLVADKEKTLDVEAAGSADIAAHRPMETDTLFWIASQSKSMTACALMMLVDEGKVKLDDPVEKFLPEFKGQMVAGQAGPSTPTNPAPPAHPITVREILCHTSGLPFSVDAEKPTLDGLPLAEAVRAYARTPLMFQPGTRHEYSNAGINTAGRIIEVVSGMPYERFLDTRLLTPLGMKDTTFWPGADQVKRLAKSYKPDAAGQGLEEIRIAQLRYPLDDREHRHPMPAGGLFSTAEDVSRFCRLLLEDGVFEGKRLVSTESVREMTRRQTAAGMPQSYGLGLAVGDGWFGHGGAHSTNMSIDRRRGLVIVWMVQHAGFPGEGGKAQDAFREAALAAFGPKP